MDNDIVAGMTYDIIIPNGTNVTEPGDYGRRYYVSNPNAEVVRVTVVRVYQYSARVRLSSEDARKYIRDARTYNDMFDIKTSLGDLRRYISMAGDPSTANILQVPEGKIDPRDPNLEWFWDLLSADTDVKGYCNVYDDILAKFGLPRRKRIFNVAIDIGNGVMVTASALARNKEDAERIARETLRTAFTPTSAEETADAV